MSIRRYLMMMGVKNIDMDKWEIINDVILTEDSGSIVITTDSNGNPFKLKKVAYIIKMKASASTTANSNAYVRMERGQYIMTKNAVVRGYDTQDCGEFEVIAVRNDQTSGSAAIISTGGLYSSGLFIAQDAKPYTDYFEYYAAGTAKFGAGTRLQLLGVKA